MQEDIQFIEDPGGMQALFREARERTSAQLQREFYVALNLEQMPINDARELVAAHPSGDMPPLVEHKGSQYYLLTPVHFAWLHSRMRGAKAAHKSGKLSDSAWATARMLWNEVLEKAGRAYGRSTLDTAVKNFRPGSYRPATSSAQFPRGQAQAMRADGIPASCPYGGEKLEQASREYPNLVPCPRTRSPWWWVEKRWCDTKCKGHPECIRALYWSAPATL